MSSATATWWPTRSTATGSLGWCCWSRATRRTTTATRRFIRSDASASSPSEDQSRSYRLAHVEAIPEGLTAADRVTLGDLREELAALIPVGLPGLQVPDGLADEDLVNGIAQLIDIDPVDRLGLLEQPGPVERAQALIDLLYIRSALRR